MGSGIDLNKMSQNISMSIKSQPNSILLNQSNSKSKFKIKIDAF
jgi:hypothetical protein